MVNQKNPGSVEGFQWCRQVDMSTLSREKARRLYDRIGRIQDTQAFYEHPAVDRLIEHGRFSSATNVFEFGCGTGRVAEELLEDHLPGSARYLGVDISQTMVELASDRLARFGPRARVELCPPRVSELDPGVEGHVFDRVLSTYVFDLLSEDDILAVLSDAHELLSHGGYLCVASLSRGTGVVSGLVSGAIMAVHRISPSLLGGCRPIELLDYMSPPDWVNRYHDNVSRFGITSEVVVAEPGKKM